MKEQVQDQKHQGVNREKSTARTTDAHPTNYPEQQMAEFPKTIYITREDDGADDTYLNVNEGVPNVDKDTPLGIYQLAEVAEIVVTREVKTQEIKKKEK